jgi:hypothetical protein
MSVHGRIAGPMTDRPFGGFDPTGAIRPWSRRPPSYRCSVPVTSMLTRRLPRLKRSFHGRQTSRAGQSGTGVSGPYRSAISNITGLAPVAAVRRLYLGGKSGTRKNPGAPCCREKEARSTLCHWITGHLYCASITSIKPLLFTCLALNPRDRDVSECAGIFAIGSVPKT